MAENLFCEELNCGEPAQVFGFVGRLKQKACQEHSLLLIDKQITLYSIAAFAFMQSPEDASLYEQRRGQMERGLSTLTSLETACEANWEEEQKRLQERCEATHAVVQQTYQEMWLRSQQSYEQVKRDLAGLRNQIERLLVGPQFQLSPEVADLCEEAPPDRLFSVIAGDTRISVAETLMTNYQVLVWDMKREKKRSWGQELRQFAENQAAANRFDIAVRVAEYASQLGVEGSDYSNEANLQSEETTHQLRCLFSKTTINEAEECLKAGQTADKTGDFEAGLIELQRGRDLLRGSDNWELYLRLSCKMAEIHLQREHYEETVEVCQHILSTWTSSAHSLEFLQAIFYLIYSHIQLEQLFTALAIEEVWAKKLIADCSACHCVKFHTSGYTCSGKGEVEEGIEYLERALQIADSSYLLTICSYRLLGEISMKQSQFEKSEEAYQSACELCITHYPHSIEHAYCLIDLGLLYQTTQRFQKAQEQFIKVIQLCFTHFPHSIQYAKCLDNLGVLYGEKQRLQEAEELFIKAIQLYSTRFPHSIEYTKSLFCLGVIYENMQRFQEAEEQYMKAAQLCSTHFPHSIQHAKCLDNLGGLYGTMQQPQDAEEQYTKAIQLYSTYFPDSIEYAECLKNLGVLYGNIGRRREAVTCLEEARLVYVRAGDQDGVDNCDTALESL